ncbi:MAG: ferrous iron transport protein B [Firmicutes bacterium]|nr:ferrous iron transport protein B [Bacillota bacterium]
MIFALAGNQNSGKTTLFNCLTGSNQRVGNFPGVTVGMKEGVIRGTDAVLVDLPGIYSVSPYTGEENVTRDFLINEKPDCIINIVDAVNIERNLYLSLQLMELDTPIVIALNMIDEVRANGGEIDTQKLQELTGVPVVAVSAMREEGIDVLIDAAMSAAATKRQGKKQIFSGVMRQTADIVSGLIDRQAKKAGMPLRFAAMRLIEGDLNVDARLNISDYEKTLIEKSITKMEKYTGNDRETAVASARYEFIDAVCQKAITKKGIDKAKERSLKIDSVLTDKYLAIPAFIAIMFMIFYISFSVVGSRLSGFISVAIDGASELTESFLLLLKVNPIVRSLIIDGIFAGVGSVISFLPVIMALFFFLSILEDSGYMARTAFIMDRLLCRIGLSGRSFVPLITGFGCSVPAIMASRTLASEDDRKMTIMLVPFVSCGAKLPVYAMFTAAFFPKDGPIIMICIYLLGIFAGILSAVVFRGTVFSKKPDSFVMELPNYRMPKIESVLILMWDKAKEFITKAFTVILAASVIIWFARTFDIHLNVASESGESILARAGMFLVPLFKPLGFGNWQSAAALIAGFSAKEAVAGAMAVLTGSGISELPKVLSSMFTPLEAISFLTFILLYPPCAAAIGAMKKEIGGKAAFVSIVYQLAAAWTASFIVYNIGLFILQ